LNLLKRDILVMSWFLKVRFQLRQLVHRYVAARAVFDANFTLINRTAFAADYMEVVRAMAPGAQSIGVELFSGSVIAVANITYGADARSANETNALRMGFTQSRLR
jgi:hypothetical protein